ncbi:unnamed protein product [Nippostrongylus brasiliensis]|uniref:Uncharacterized protein n=1 Tax=Nippostrongylus brasiliensis TaxID=27835 RepID=A0A0N4XEL6_NIPBR|nr:hypothetical protein Q1695_015434 [Nippostrongylus brasiliensis]VDL64121.1 unnamed protein product [Nippostrongylus brasiliensis]
MRRGGEENYDSILIVGAWRSFRRASDGRLQRSDGDGKHDIDLRGDGETRRGGRNCESKEEDDENIEEAGTPKTTDDK